ncbi:RidA family protein [Sphingobium fuliginis ATCC 27551]|uniref:RidA family protein n=2 Tax=Sphingobium fuliginis (strain ATCC 27551) TaxID=336203 RepID=A0A5B8CDL4_SPHSA|nr:RidA family protein [Sphingobium fuliginis ATCC 27551]
MGYFRYRCALHIATASKRSGRWPRQSTRKILLELVEEIMTDRNFNKTNVNHNKGWARDLFSDVSIVEAPAGAKYLFLSGVSAEDPEATDLHSVTILGDGDFRKQTQIAFRKIKTVLAAHGATLADVVRMTAYVTDRANIWTYFEVQGEELDGAPRPPHTFLEISSLAVPEMLVEIEVTAMIGLNPS